eukprot:EG_transcript_50642
MNVENWQPECSKQFGDSPLSYNGFVAGGKGSSFPLALQNPVPVLDLDVRAPPQFVPVNCHDAIPAVGPKDPHPLEDGGVLLGLEGAADAAAAEAQVGGCGGGRRHLLQRIVRQLSPIGLGQEWCRPVL